MGNNFQNMIFFFNWLLFWEGKPKTILWFFDWICFLTHSENIKNASEFDTTEPNGYIMVPHFLQFIPRHLTCFSIFIILVSSSSECIKSRPTWRAARLAFIFHCDNINLIFTWLPLRVSENSFIKRRWLPLPFWFGKYAFQKMCMVVLPFRDNNHQLSIPISNRQCVISARKSRSQICLYRKFSAFHKSRMRVSISWEGN